MSAVFFKISRSLAGLAVTTALAVVLVANADVVIAQDAPGRIYVGQGNSVKLKIPDQRDSSKCNVELALPGDVNAQREASAPAYEVEFELNPLKPGPLAVAWKGKFKARGLSSVMGCSGSGTFQLDAVYTNEEVKKRWDDFLSRSSPEQAECTSIGLRVLKLPTQPTGDNSKLYVPTDREVGVVAAKCEAFNGTRLAWRGKAQQAYSCTIQGGIETLCDGFYAEKLPDGNHRIISKEEAIQLHFENKSWTTAQRENLDAKTNRLRVEQEAKAKAELELKLKREAEEFVRREAEEKERIFRASPEYKRQQEELARRREAEERELALRLKREKEESDKRRILEERAQAEREKRSRFEAEIRRPMISEADPKLACASKIEFDPRFSELSSKISLSGLTSISFAMLSDANFIAPKDMAILSSWADEIRRCSELGARFRTTSYTPELAKILEKEDEEFLALAIDLYQKKINFGTYNSKVQQIAKDVKRSIESLEQKLKADRVAAEEASRVRAAALREAQLQQEEKRREEQRRQEQIRAEAQRRQEAEAARIAEVRRQWAARCEFDQKNAYDGYMKSHDRDCNGGNRGLAALCVIGTISAAKSYGESAFNSCMSGAPN